MGACYLWAGTILVPTYWSGLLLKYPHDHPERRVVVYATLFFAILLPLTVMFLLHYYGYVPVPTGILPYLLGTFALGPLTFSCICRCIEPRQKDPNRVATDGCHRKIRKALTGSLASINSARTPALDIQMSLEHNRITQKNMSQKHQNASAHPESPLVRITNWLVSVLLFLSFLVLFGMAFRKLLGQSDAAWLIEAALSVTLATIACNIILKALPALLILLLIAFPSIILIVVFLLM